MKQKVIIALLLIAFSLFLFLRAKAQTIKIKIVATSDVHGCIMPFDYLTRKESKSSLASVTTYLKQQRADTSQAVILLDNGDFLQGQPIVYYSNFERTDTQHIAAQVMNYMGYAAASVGNHDIETGHKVYDLLVTQFQFPWLAANAINTNNGNPYFAPYCILKQNGIRIAILGMITPNVPSWLPPSIYSGMEFDDMIVSAREWVAKIREVEHPDLMVGLFHSGNDFTFNGMDENTPKNENASMLAARKVEGLNIVISGHDHIPVDSIITNDFGQQVVLLNPGGLAENISEALCVFKKSKKSIELKSIQPALIPTENYTPDPDFVNHFTTFHNEVITYVNRPIGKLVIPFTARDALFGPSPLINLIHQVQFELTGAEVSFTAPFSINSDFEAGTLTVSDMFKLYRFENLLYTMKLTGKEIKNYLEFSYGLWYQTMTSADDHLLKLKRNEKGEVTGRLMNPVYNLSSAAGINYIVDVSKPEGQRITILSMADGTIFNPDKIYRVAINSYRGNGGGNHLTTGSGIPREKLVERIEKSTDKDLRFYMIQWIEKHGEIHPPDIKNWEILPRDWIQAAKEKDLSTLFPR